MGPDYEQPRLAIPAHWGSRKEQKPAKPPELSQWWLQLRDPLLNTLIAEAVEGNLDVALAKAKIREARATYREQKGTLLPAADSSASITRTRSASADGSSDASVYTQYQGGFDASWELDLFGGNRRGLEAAQYKADAAEEELRDTLVTLVGDVASYYIQAREYQALLALARSSAVSQRETAKLTREQFEAGEATGVDDAKADAQALSTEADIPTYQISYTQTVHRLSILLGQAGGAGGTAEEERRDPTPENARLHGHPGRYPVVASGCAPGGAAGWPGCDRDASARPKRSRYPSVSADRRPSRPPR